MPGNPAEGGEAGKGIAGSAEGGVRAAGFNGWRSITRNIEYEEDRAPCLQTKMPPDVVVGVDGHNQNLTGDIVNTLRGGRVDKDNIGLVILKDQGGGSINVEKGEISPTLRGQSKGHEPLVFEPGAVSRTGNHYYEDGTTGTLRANMGDNQFAVALENHPNDSRIKIIEDGKIQTLSSRMRTGGGNVPLLMTKDNKPDYTVITYGFKSFGQYKADDVSQTRKARNDPTTEDLILDPMITNKYIIRRLTPLECERLQGLPDYWTEYGIMPEKYRTGLHEKVLLQKISDSQRYKALGNGMSHPCVDFVVRRVKETA
ncbi:DNA cytosine methyltransferase [Treponema sp. R6D11]